jgi:hypothetical protein
LRVSQDRLRDGREVSKASSSYRDRRWRVTNWVQVFGATSFRPAAKGARLQGRPYTNVQWSEMPGPFNLLLLGNGGTPPPTRLLMPFVLSADVPDTALGALLNMSVQLRNPGLGERRARGSLH